PYTTLFRSIRRAMLVERLARDAVRIALHHERAVLDDRQDERRDLHVVPQEIALGQTLRGPEDLLQVADVERVAVGQDDRSAASRALELAQLLDDEPVRGVHVAGQVITLRSARD